MDHLRSVYSPILDLQNLEETFLARATQEYEARLNADFVQKQTKKWGRTNKKDQEVVEREVAFSKYLNTLSIHLKLLSKTYQVIIKCNILICYSWHDFSITCDSFIRVMIRYICNNIRDVKN